MKIGEVISFFAFLLVMGIWIATGDDHWGIWSVLLAITATKYEIIREVLSDKD